MKKGILVVFLSKCEKLVKKSNFSKVYSNIRIANAGCFRYYVYRTNLTIKINSK